MTLFKFILAGTLAFSMSPGMALAKTEQLVVYSNRSEQLIKTLFDEYSKETGMKIELMTGEPGPMIERLKAEGSGTTGDLFISVDAGSLWQAEKEGLFEPIQSKTLKSKVPSHLRSPTGAWYGLSLRSRTIFYNTDKVKPTDLVSYDDLSTDKWRGKLCMRTSKKVYNQSLVAMLIAEKGEEQASKIVKGWVDNLATNVFDNDTKLLEAIDRGECAVGLANTYYLSRLVKEGKAKKVGVYFPPSTHMNVSGAGVLKHSKNKPEATKLLEWLATPKAQKLFADANMEYPVVAGIEPDPIVKAWGQPKPSTTPLHKAGELQRTATLLMDRAKYQ